MITLALAMTVTFPSGTARWVDGGFVNWDGDTFTAKDARWGVLTGADSIGEGLGNEIPGFRFSCAPAFGASNLFDADNNGAAVTVSLLELDADTHAVTSAETQWTGMIGGCEFTFARDGMEAEFEVVAMAERAFIGNVGNGLDPTYHKAMWAGERGEDNATGLTVPVAWGAPSPTVSGSTATAGGASRGYLGTTMNLS